MTRKTSVLRAAAAAALLCATGLASAGTITPEATIGWASGKDIDLNGNRSRHTITLGAAVSYQFDNRLGARLMTFSDLDPYRGLWEDERSFDTFYGLQAIGALPLGEHANLTGGVGLGRTDLNRGNHGTQELTDGVLSVGLQVPMGHHYAMELRVDHLTSSGITNVGLHFQIPF